MLINVPSFACNETADKKKRVCHDKRQRQYNFKKENIKKILYSFTAPKDLLPSVMSNYYEVAGQIHLLTTRRALVST